MSAQSAPKLSPMTPRLQLRGPLSLGLDDDALALLPQPSPLTRLRDANSVMHTPMLESEAGKAVREERKRNESVSFPPGHHHSVSSLSHSFPMPQEFEVEAIARRKQKGATSPINFTSNDDEGDDGDAYDPDAIFSKRRLRPTAAAAMLSYDDDRSQHVKQRLKKCGLSEELIDLLRPAISKDQIASMWHYYDSGDAPSSPSSSSNSSNTLLPDDVLRITEWLYSRVPILFRQMIQKANPNLTRQQKNDLVVEHLPHLLPGTTQEICEYFMNTLPVGPDGRISKDDFVTHWNRHARLIFPSSHHAKSSIKGAAQCTIL